MPRKNGIEGLHDTLLVRKVQKLGASSLIVTLPRDWARRHGVNVGDNVLIHDEGDRLVIDTKDKDSPQILSLDLSKSHIARHVGRLTLFSYIFGFDGVEARSPRSIKGEILERIENALYWMDDAYLRSLDKDKVIEVLYSTKKHRLEDLLSSYGKAVSSLLGELHLFIRGEKRIDRDILDDVYHDLMRTNYSLLRAANSWKPINSIESIKVRYLSATINLIGLVADATYKLAVDLLNIKDELTNDERERLSLLLEILEVVTSTLSSSLIPPSIKKNEDSYWKIKNILDLEGNIKGILKDSTPAFGYALARIIDIARILEVAENILLCNAMLEKFNKPEATH